MNLNKNTMNLKTEFCKRIDNDFGYDNEKLAEDLIQIAKKHFKEQLRIADVSESKADEREEAYKKYFRDHPNFRGKSIRYKGDYIFHKDEAYDCIDYYLRTGIEP